MCSQKIVKGLFSQNVQSCMFDRVLTEYVSEDYVGGILSGSFSKLLYKSSKTLQSGVK